MQTLRQQSCILGALLYFLGCGTDAVSPRGTDEEGGETNVGSSTSGSAKNDSGNHKGGTTATAPKGKGGNTDSKGGGEASGGHSVGAGGSSSNADGTGGRGQGGSSNASKGGADGSGGKSGPLGVGGKGFGTGGSSLGIGGKNLGTGGSSLGAGGKGAGTGGSTGTAGSASTDVDCSAAMPTGGQSHSGNSQGGTGNLAWQIWSNQGSGTLTTFSTPAFSAGWNNSGDYLGRLGYEWGNGGKTYESYGTIKAQYSFKKTGSGGGFSYIGIYGWSTNPCVEWYIIDDSFNAMPFTPYNSGAKGSQTIDGETYKLFSNSTNGTGGSRCNQSSWSQFWSVRQKARQCGTITISDHFKAWDAAGMKLGNLLEAKILVETGGGSGSVDFPVANVTLSQ